ncbi:MAG TPA: ATP-binding cassette domain-containing protein, partial [Acidobacteriota bacterium]
MQKNKAISLVSLQDVSFAYGGQPVLDSVSFDIMAGDFLAVLGPNGSGKTTLLKIILNLLKPSRGRVLVQGRPLEEFQDRERIGYVPQKATQVDPYFPASVAETVSMALRRTTGRTADRKTPYRREVDRALSLVGLKG